MDRHLLLTKYINKKKIHGCLMHNNHAQSCTRAKPDFSSVMQLVAPCKHFPRHRKPHHNTTLRKSSDKRKSDATRVGLSDPSPSDTTYSLG